MPKFHFFIILACEELVRICHTCEELVRICHTCEELVRIVLIGNNLYQIFNHELVPNTHTCEGSNKHIVLYKYILIV